ncbi:MAG: suppressor of fused domain protein [Phycisphaerales bacterium]|nr:suppressor of fused domain protein [Phycisphaerales bacterium]
MSSPHPTEEYTPKDRPFEPATGNDDTLEAVDKYADRFLGGVQTVLHEVMSDLIHLDVHICPPTPGRDCYTLITSGMSDRPMPKADEWGVPPYAELMLRLPSTWPMPKTLDVVADYQTDATWPIDVLKKAARMPHDCDSALGYGHTISFDRPPGPLHTSVRFVSLMLLPTVQPVEVADSFTTRDGRTVYVYVLHPLLPDELEHKLKEGRADSLFPYMDACKLSEVIDVNRPSVLRSPPALPAQNQPDRFPPSQRNGGDSAFEDR